MPAYSNEILDILASQCVKATYFMVGEMARAYPAVVRRVYEEGHTIGTHSEDHPLRFGQLPVKKIRHEIDWGISDVAAALGGARYLAPFFRIPGLARSDVLESELAARGLVVFSSDTDADDWHRHIKPDQIIALAMGRLEALGKGILLLHHIPPWSVAELDASFVVRPGEFEATLRFKRRGESGIKAGGSPIMFRNGAFDAAIFFHDTGTGPGG